MADTNVQADDTAESPVPAGGNEPTETVTMRMADDTFKEDDGKGEEGQIPSWRLKEEADNRRAAEDRAAQLERMLTIANARNNTNPQVTEAGVNWKRNTNALVIAKKGRKRRMMRS